MGVDLGYVAWLRSSPNNLINSLLQTSIGRGQAKLLVPKAVVFAIVHPFPPTPRQPVNRWHETGEISLEQQLFALVEGLLGTRVCHSPLCIRGLLESRKNLVLRDKERVYVHVAVLRFPRVQQDTHNCLPYTRQNCKVCFIIPRVINRGFPGRDIK